MDILVQNINNDYISNLELNFIRNLYIKKPIYKFFSEPYGIYLSPSGIEYLKVFHPEIFELRKFNDVIFYIWNIQPVLTPIDQQGKSWYWEFNEFIEWIKEIMSKYPV